MKNIVVTTLLFPLLFVAAINAQKKGENLNLTKMNDYEIIKTESHIPGLNIALLHKAPNVISNDYPVLFLSGSSIPSSLSLSFRMGNYSWMDNLTENAYDVYALDFLGFGNADRYPEMKSNLSAGKLTGRATDAYLDVAKAVDLICKKTGKNKVYLIAHSWGGSVAALYAGRFNDKVEKLILYATITARQSAEKPQIIQTSYKSLTPKQRVDAFKNLTPPGKECQMEKEMLETFGKDWLLSDLSSREFKTDSVRYPSGPQQDVEDLLHNKPYYDPAEIRVPVLVVRGEWDNYPNNNDGDSLFRGIENAPYKKYVVIAKSTHIIHWEKARYQLYDETLRFLKFRTNMKETKKHAIAVIFEVIPADRHKDENLKNALSLRSELEKIKGFISVERFQSIYHSEKILSLSFWESEEAIQKWRNLEVHHNAQAKGREYIFKDYHLRIAQVVRDYGIFDRNEAPADSKSSHK